MRLLGRNPLSTSISHSYPSVPFGNVAVAPAARVATEVLRQQRCFPKAAGTVIDVVSPSFTPNIWPFSAFWGRPPSAGGLKRGSAHVPVHVGGSCGSMTAFACVSL